jgi:hypothetical protein
VPSTLQAVLALVLVVLPGAIYLWGFEREAGKWAIGISDTLLRFVAASAIFQALYAAPLYVFYERYVHHDVARQGSRDFENPLSDGHVPWWLALLPLAYVGLPAVLGRSSDARCVASGRSPSVSRGSWQGAIPLRERGTTCSRADPRARFAHASRSI